MWTWFLQLFGFRTSYRHRRQIYSFWDGTRKRRADPVETWMKLGVILGEDWTDLMETMASDAPPGTVGASMKMWLDTQNDAATKVSAAVCQAFGVDALADAPGEETTGLTRTERIALAADFIAYMDNMAARAQRPTISLSPTAASPPA